MLDYEFLKFISEYMWIYKDFLLPLIICDEMFTAYWSNSQARSVYPDFIGADSIRRMLGEFDFDELRARLKSDGICRIEGILGLSGVSVNVTPIMNETELVGIMVWFFGPQAVVSPGEIIKSSRTQDYLEKSIRERVEEIFGIMDAAALKADILEAAWVKPSLEGISKNGYFLLRTVSNISHYITYQSQAIKLSLQAVDFFEMLSESKVMVIGLAESMGIPVRFDLPEEKGFVGIDTDKMQMAYINILHNCLYFTRPDNSIDIIGKIEPDEYVVTIRDRGAGIPEQDLPFIYQPYFSGGHDGKPAGIGLGLTLAKMIIEAHGGTLSVESVINEGTTATFTVPVRNFSKSIKFAQGKKAHNSSDRFSYLYVGLYDAAASLYNDEQ